MATKIPVRSRSIAQLTNLSTPVPGQLEAVRWPYFDTQPITSTVTTTLKFFSTVQSDPTLGNLELAGQIQNPNWFELYAIKCDFLFPGLVVGAAPGTAGPITDMAAILFQQRAFYEFTVNSKSYGKTPLSLAHGTGGPVGLAQGTPAAAAFNSFGTNSVPDEGDWLGGWVFDPNAGGQQEVGSIILASTQSFQLTVTMAAAPTLTTTPLNVRMTMMGVLHRQVR